MKVTLTSSQRLYDIMNMKPYFYCKKNVIGLLNFTSQGRRRLHTAKSMSSKQLMIRGNLLYIPLGDPMKNSLQQINRLNR